MSTQFDLAQTFYLDAPAVRGASHAFVTSVDLYFQSKPEQGNTKTGINKPGVTAYICDTDINNVPDLTRIHDLFQARVEYDDIVTSSVGETATKFTFRNPVSLSTNRTYGILIKFDGSDDDFKLWYNKSGENKLGTTVQTQVNSGVIDGNLFTITNGFRLNPIVDADLSFKINVARFEGTATQTVKSQPFENMVLSDVNGRFKGGEYVYQEVANGAGTVTVRVANTLITGNGTDFENDLAVGEKIVLTDGTAGNVCVRTIASITNATSLNIDANSSFLNAAASYKLTVLGKVSRFDFNNDTMVLKDSTANSTLYFAAGNTVHGVDSGANATLSSLLAFPVNVIVPNFNIKTPAATVAKVEINIADENFNVDAANQRAVVNGQRNAITGYAAVIASHSQAVTNPSGAFDTLTANITFTTGNPYVTPYVREESLDMFAETYTISTDAEVDDEFTGSGSSQSRYVTKTITLRDDLDAEDIRVFARGHVPQGSNVHVFAKLLSRSDDEALINKHWTPLKLLNRSVIGTSSGSNIGDLKELEFAIPTFQKANTMIGSFSANTSNTLVTGAGTAYANGTACGVNDLITAGDVIRLYSKASSAIEFVGYVVTSNSSSFTLSEEVPFITSTGLTVDKTTRVKSGYINKNAANVVSYFNSSGARFDTFSTYAIKVVLTSEDGKLVPYLDDIRAIAVSA